jgi:uncharacterized protein YjbJ (UPF0337 family)
MNWDRIEGNCKQLSGMALQQWGKLTNNQLAVLAGQRDRLRGRIQARFGLSRDAAKQQTAELKKRIKAFNRATY